MSAEDAFSVNLNPFIFLLRESCVQVLCNGRTEPTCKIFFDHTDLACFKIELFFSLDLFVKYNRCSFFFKLLFNLLILMHLFFFISYLALSPFMLKMLRERMLNQWDIRNHLLQSFYQILFFHLVMCSYFWNMLL